MGEGVKEKSNCSRLSPQKFWIVRKLSEIFLSENCCPRMQNLGKKLFHFGKKLWTNLKF